MDGTGPAAPPSPETLEKLRDMFVEHAPQSFAMFDREMRYLFASRRWLSDFQLEGQGILGKSHYEVLPEIPERWKEVHRRALAGATEQSDEDIFIRADGTVTWSRWEVLPWRDDVGEIGGLLIFSEDITDRKRAEEALRISESRLRLAVEATGLGTWDFDPIAWSIAADARTKLLFGISPDVEMTYDDFLRALHPDDREAADAAVRRSLDPASGGRFAAEYRIVRLSDRQERWLQGQGRAFFSPEGRAIRLIGSVLDVTDRNRARQDLEQSFSLLQATIDATSDGIHVVNLDGKIVTFNRRFAEMWGLPGDLLAHRDDEAALTYARRRMKDPDAFVARVRELYARPQEEGSGTVALVDGRCFEWLSHPQLLGGKVVGRVWDFRDVTQRRQAEAQRDRLLVEEREARQAAERAFREAQAAVRARDEFLSIASHEMKTPLTSMKVQIQQAKKLLDRAQGGTIEVERVRPMVALALRQLQRLQFLTEELLDVERIGSPSFELEYEPINLRTVTEAVILERREAARRAHTEIRLEGPQHLFGTWDRWRLEQLLGALIDNAIKFGAGKPIQVRLSQNPDEAVASVSVADQGIGIAEKDHERIFDRFERAVDSSHYGGFGIGLWIVRRIVDAFGGRISLTSAPQKGATFTVELPRAPRARTDAATAAVH